jgi:protein NrfC
MKDRKRRSGLSRRDFLKLSAGAVVGGAVPRLTWLDNGLAAIPAAGGYLLVDTRKCQGCMTCMLACSLVHEGRENLSLSRIQVIQNPFGKFPDDVTLEQCRQCVEPACLEACPTGALHVDTENGNVRRVNADKCIGCMSCVNACAYPPSRAIWNHEEGHAQKCDLCVATPHWDETGGPDGKRACVQVCPVGAISYVSEIPAQEGDEGYTVNLRGDGWRKLGFTLE